MTRKEAKNEIRKAFNKWIGPLFGHSKIENYTEFMQEVNEILKKFEKSR